MQTYVIVSGYAKLAKPKIYLDYDEAKQDADRLDTHTQVDYGTDDDLPNFESYRVLKTETYNELVLQQNETDSARL